MSHSTEAATEVRFAPGSPLGPRGDVQDAGISAAVTHATSGRRWESVTWQASPGTVHGAGTTRQSGGLGAAPRGEVSAAVVKSPEPEVPRVPIAPARPAADRHFRPGPPSSLI